MNRLLFVLLSGILLMGCSDDKEKSETSTENDQEKITEAVQEESTEQEDSHADHGKSEDDKGEQTDLKVGETGNFDTLLGTYEITLDDLILLDLTIKNTNDEPLEIDDLLYSMVVTDDIEGSGFYDAASEFDSIEEFRGKLDPGEEKSGKFITDVLESDEYYFQKNFSGDYTKNGTEVIWVIQADEAK